MYSDDGFIIYKRSLADPNTKISTNFRLSEYFCKCGECENQPINKRLFPKLEELRARFNAPITITSGYRCPPHNKKIGGAPKSRHTIGDAVDAVVRWHSTAKVGQAAKELGFTGIKIYRSWVHLDLRPPPEWYSGFK